MFNALLPQRAALSLSGADVIEFLQGIISNDARQLAEGNPVYAALLSPQGRFLHDFFLIPWQGKIFLDMQADRAGDLLSRFKIYRLRSKVEIEKDESVSIAALWGGKINAQENPEYRIYNDPRLPQMGMRVIGSKNTISALGGQVGAEEYEKLRLSLVVPDTRDMVVEKSLLLECGFEELNGVDFNKGCYVGQEVTARSKFRGQVRKSFYEVKSDSSLPAYGEKIMAEDKTIGEMRTSLDKTGMAMVYNEEYKTARASGLNFVCNGMELQLFPARWIKGN